MFLARMSFFLSSFFMFFIDDKNYSYGRCIFLILPKMVFPIFVKPKTDHPVDPREARHGLGGAGRRHRPAGNLRPAADSHPSCRKNTLQRTKLLQTPLSQGASGADITVQRAFCASWGGSRNRRRNQTDWRLHQMDDSPSCTNDACTSIIA